MLGWTPHNPHVAVVAAEVVVVVVAGEVAALEVEGSQERSHHDSTSTHKNKREG